MYIGKISGDGIKYGRIRCSRRENGLWLVLKNEDFNWEMLQKYNKEGLSIFISCK